MHVIPTNDDVIVLVSISCRPHQLMWLVMIVTLCIHNALENVPANGANYISDKLSRILLSGNKL